MPLLVTLRRASLVALLLAVVVAAAGCGGSDDTESQTQDWANGMCSALDDWQNSVKAAGDKISQGDLSKSSLQEAANSVSDANKQLRDDLDSLGKPPTDTVDKAKSDLTQLSKELSANLQKIQDAIGNISGDNASSAITAVASAVQSMGQDFQNTATQLQALENDDTWKKAFENSESCQKLSG